MANNPLANAYDGRSFVDALLLELGAEFPNDALHAQPETWHNALLLERRDVLGNVHSFALDEDDCFDRTPSQLVDFVAGALMGDVWPN